VKPSPVLIAARKALAGRRGTSAGETLVAGLSGGADSVALVDVLATLSAERGFRVVAAHLDHGLRPDSPEDALFCRDLCRQLGVELRSAHVDVRARATRKAGGLEAAAREARYAFLRQVMAEEGAPALAVAHTRDDQAETVLLRLLRGSGATGLAAMRLSAGQVLRPLLDVSRAQVVEHLEARGLAWREDPSNRDTRLARNRVRHELLPYLESRFNPGIRGVLARTAGVLADEADLLDRLAAELVERVVRVEAGSVALDRAGLGSAPAALARLAIRRVLESAGGLRGVSAVHVQAVLDLARTGTSGQRRVLPGGREAVVTFGDVRLAPRRVPAAPFSFPLPVPGRVELPDGLAVVARAGDVRAVSNQEEPSSVTVDAAGEPLEVRTRRPGDRIRVKGREMSLKRFLMERRVPADLRSGLPLVAAGRRVLWVPGYSGAGRPGGEGAVRLSLARVR
jgi:tRNA(Ile)-lysidine synthase